MKKIVREQSFSFAIIGAIIAASTWYYENPWSGYIQTMTVFGIGMTAIGIIRIIWAAIRNRTEKD